MAERAWRLLREIAEEYRAVLKDNLVGIYAHGSLAFGCFRWETSDIDFLAVVRRKPSIDEKLRLLRILLERYEAAPPKGFEMSVVTKTDLSPFVYPTPFELHYSNFHLKACRENIERFCSEMNGVDPDLAAHCTVVRAVGVTVCGEPLESVFGEVPTEAYLDSIWLDVRDAVRDIAENPVYVTLNLCRVLAACSGHVFSKQEGGRWAIEHLNTEWYDVIGAALNAYETGSSFCCDLKRAQRFAEWAIQEILKEKTKVCIEERGGTYHE